MIPLPPEIAQTFDSYPAAPRARLMQLRAAIFAEADACAAAPLTETLKSGEPAYLTEATKTGSTIRLAWKPKTPEDCLLLVNCRTSLIEQFRAVLPDDIAIEGKRALRIPATGDWPEDAIRACLRLALTYHKRR